MSPSQGEGSGSDSRPSLIMTKIYSDDETIEIEFPVEKAKKYLKKLNLSSSDQLTIPQKRKVFIWAIKDFKVGILALDELSEIATDLLGELPITNPGDFADALYSASELNFYVRRIKNEKDVGFVTFMSDVMDYYDKNNWGIEN